MSNMENNDIKKETLKLLLSKLNYEDLEKLLLIQTKKNLDLKALLSSKEEGKC